MKKIEVSYLKRLKDKSLKKNYVDFMFTYNDQISALYKKYISGKTIPIGSIESNDVKIQSKIKRYKKRILFISDFYDIYLNPEKIFFNKIKFNIFLDKEIKLLKEPKILLVLK